MLAPPVTPRPVATDPKPALDFLERLAAALHRFGAPAHRLEPLLGQVAERLGLDCAFFVEPASIHMAVETEHGPLSRFLRVQLGRDDLGKLADLDALTSRLIDGRLDLTGADRELALLLAAPPRFGASVEVFGFALASAMAARFFGGGATEVVTTLGTGAGIGLLAQWSARHPSTAPIFEGLASFAVAVVLYTAATLGFEVAADTVILASLIILIPGLSLTVAVSELAIGHLASGVARIAASTVSFGAIAFGVLLAKSAVAALVGPVPTASPVPMAGWTLAVALALAPISFAVLLRADTRDFVVISLAAPLGFLGARGAGLVVEPELAAFAGAFAIAAASNSLARWRRRPTSVTLVPGILLLVPGSLGFRSLTTMMSRDVVLGLETAVQMMTVAMSLVGGLLVANVLVPARRPL